MTFRVVTDDYQWRQYVDRLTRDRLPANVRRLFNRTGAVGANVYRSFIPGKSRSPFRTGRLRQSVRYKVFATRSGKVGVAVGPWGRLAADRHYMDAGTNPHRPPTTRASRPYWYALDTVASVMGYGNPDSPEARRVAFGIARRIEQYGTPGLHFAEPAGAAAGSRLHAGMDAAIQQAINESAT